jgi:hypothetical protein
MRRKLLKQKLFDAVTRELLQRDYPHTAKQQVFTYIKRYVNGDSKWYHDTEYLKDRVNDKVIIALASEMIIRAENVLEF